MTQRISSLRCLTGKTHTVPSTRRRRGFTLIELLVVVAIIALLIGILAPSLARTKELTRRAVCGSNLHGLGVATNSYAAQSQSHYPYHSQHGGNWLWDISHVDVDSIADAGAARHIFYCPSGAFQDDDKHWWFTTSFKVTGYWWMYTRIGNHPKPLIDAEYISTTTISNPSQRELITDATISWDGYFCGIYGGSPIPHRASHLDGLDPAGGNIFFVDGHVTWRDFADMKMRNTSYPSHWF